MSLRVDHQITGMIRVEPSGYTIDLRVGVMQAAHVSGSYRSDTDIVKAINAACAGLAARLEMELDNGRP